MSQADKTAVSLAQIEKLSNAVIRRIITMTKLEKGVVSLTIISFLLRLLWLDKPIGFIFDEWFYVGYCYAVAGATSRIGAAQAILRFQVDPNTEHPFLAKFLMAVSIALLGDNQWGWRIPAVLLGTACIPLIYLLIKKLSGNGLLAFISAFLTSFDSLFFVHSRTALLDIYFVFFMILAFYLLILNRVILAPLALALSFLSKEAGLFGVPIVLAYVLLAGRKSIKMRLLYCARFLIFYFIFLFGIWGWWHLWAPSGFAGSIEHFRYIFQYASWLKGPNPPAICSKPWEWIFPQLFLLPDSFAVHMVLMKDWFGKTISIPYHAGGIIQFWGTGNPAIWCLTIPAIAFVLYNYLGTRDRLSLFTLLWFSFTYFPYVLMAFEQRFEYIFYFLPSIPPVSIAITQALLSKNPPKLVILAYLATVVILFFVNFPIRSIP